MHRETVYKRLEDTFLRYRDLAPVAIRDLGEPMVSLSGTPGIRTRSLDDRMKPFTGDDIYVRRSVADRLGAAQTALADSLPGHVLEIIHGYRHPVIQKKSYEDMRDRLGLADVSPDDEDAKERIHRFVAVPEVAGHPTGGAVDVRILAPDFTPLDMGTEIRSFVEDSYVHSPFIGREAWHNRQLLRLCMTMAGFAPFDGEWWHFSYGDREWAKYYGKPFALYDQMSFTSVEGS